jgi:hypothetical protein
MNRPFTFRGFPLMFVCMMLFATVSYSQTFYVNKVTGNDAGAGTSWATAFRNVTRAVAAAQASTAPTESIWVTQGIYSPIEGLSSLPSDHSDTSFTFYRGKGVSKSLKVYGGFIGTETSVAARDTLHHWD